jgi:hypothetical protein
VEHEAADNHIGGSAGEDLMRAAALGLSGVVLSVALGASPAAAQTQLGSYVLLADNAQYLARCNGCTPGGAYADSAFVHETNPDAGWAQWSIERRPNGKYVLRADTGAYLARCNGCIPGAAYADSAFVHETNPDAGWAQWSIERRPNGKYVLRADTGAYLARCNGCIPGGAYADSAFVHETNPDASWAQWSLAPTWAN